MCPDFYGTQSVCPQFGSYNGIRNYCAATAPLLPNVSCMGYDPLSMDYSVYGSDIDLASDYTAGCWGYGGGYGGGYAPMPAAGGEYTPGPYGYNPNAMYEQMDKWTDYMLDRNVRYTEKTRANDMRINGPLDATQYAADALREKIVKDAQPQVVQAFENYKQTLRKVYPEYANLDDKALSAKAMELYKQRNNVSLKDDIRANSKDIFAQKFLNGATFGLLFKGSAEETISDITGNPITHEDKVKGSIGTVAGAAVSLTAAFQALKHSGSILKVAARNPIGTLILGAAAALGIYSYGK